jgi:hypothetical protein
MAAAAPGTEATNELGYNDTPPTQPGPVGPLAQAALGGGAGLGAASHGLPRSASGHEQRLMSASEMMSEPRRAEPEDDVANGTHEAYGAEGTAAGEARGLSGPELEEGRGGVPGRLAGAVEVAGPQSVASHLTGGEQG